MKIENKENLRCIICNSKDIKVKILFFDGEIFACYCQQDWDTIENNYKELDCYEN